MQWFRNLRLMAQVMGMVYLGVAFLVVVGFTGFYFNNQAGLGLKELYYERILPLNWIQESRINIRAIEANLLAFAATSDKAARDSLEKEMAERSTKISEYISSYEKTELNELEKSHLEAFKTNLANMRADRKTYANLVNAGKTQEAFQLYNTKIAVQVDDVQKELRTLSDYHVKRADEVNKQNERNSVISNSIISGLSLLALILCSGFGYWMARSIARPVGSVTGALVEVANGNLGIRDVFVNTKNEVGTLASALNTMKTNMANLVSQIQNNAQQVAASSEELTASSEQSAQAANNIATSIAEVAEGAATQVTAADESSSVVEQMSAGIQQVAANTNQVADDSAKATGRAKEGEQTIEKAVNQMLHVQETVSTSAKVVAKLGERSKEIGQIVDTISGIAGQTNLLALNAAIEAARAGEQGRGFAVVAEEVRKLAEQSQDAAKKIAELIGEIQGDTDTAVVSMNAGTGEVKTGVEVVHAAGVAFREIVELISRVSGQVREISAAIQQIASGSQQIVGSVKKIDTLSKKSASEAQSVSAATEEQLASMEEIATSSQALAQLAQELQAAVSSFRV